ncbi:MULTISPECIES: hypothetical protein [Comamonas]|uniref:hypothetical protein n=1 Tax=Comamonas TaxID=283 RepID=UPI0015823018|nr:MULTISPECIES: hypothetical protein [Comamonas]
MPKTHHFDIYAMTSPKTKEDILALLNEAVNELELVQATFNALHQIKDTTTA